MSPDGGFLRVANSTLADAVKYNDIDFDLTHLPPLACTNVVTAAPRRVDCITRCPEVHVCSLACSRVLSNPKLGLQVLPREPSVWWVHHQNAEFERHRQRLRHVPRTWA